MSLSFLFFFCAINVLFPTPVRLGRSILLPQWCSFGREYVPPTSLHPTLDLVTGIYFFRVFASFSLNHTDPFQEQAWGSGSTFKPDSCPWRGMDPTPLWKGWQMCAEVFLSILKLCAGKNRNARLDHLIWIEVWDVRGTQNWPNCLSPSPHTHSLMNF